jgi:hypothetical protein
MMKKESGEESAAGRLSSYTSGAKKVKFDFLSSLLMYTQRENADTVSAAS